MYQLLQQAAMPYQASMFIRKNTCCITNQQQKRYEKKQQQQRRAATDIVIDFGKYKGKMLGTLPSSYLKWVSENLREGDCEFAGWAILADQVLVDPIYRDRIEWEFAQNVLEGNNISRSREPADPVSQLEEIRDRFGWDSFDKHAWNKVKYDLLGTSKGGRIPRLDDPTPTLDKPTKPNLPPATTTTSTNRTKRMERRERLKMKLKTTDEPPSSQQQLKDDDSLPVADDINPFPGRHALLRKAIHHRAQS